MKWTTFGVLLTVALQTSCAPEAKSTRSSNGSSVATEQVEPTNSVDSPTPNNQARTAAEIEAIIDQLAAKHPKRQGSYELGVHEPQIWNAVDELHHLGTRAFPFLIKHFDDDRYCCSEDPLSGGPMYRRSVGQVCRLVLNRQVQVYVRWKIGDPRGTPGYATSIVPHKKSDALKWWLSSRDKTLWEFQADNVRLVIAMNRQRLRDEKDPEYCKLCEQAIGANEQLELEFKKNMKPLSTVPWRPYIGR